MTKSYTLMKISWELFNKCYTKLKEDNKINTNTNR